jgi:hypothetical protein
MSTVITPRIESLLGGSTPPVTLDPDEIQMRLQLTVMEIDPGKAQRQLQLHKTVPPPYGITTMPFSLQYFSSA